jgi:hypothetical protein
MAEKAWVHAKIQESKQKCSNFCNQKSKFNSSGSSTDRILQLQRTAGNQAVQRLVKSRVLQAKLRVGQPNDIYEQEADRVAEQVMRMPDPVLQRTCAKCNEAEENILRAKELPGQASVIQSQDVPPIVYQVLHSPGKPLDDETRAFMEPRLGHDFSRVRVHTDTKAAESAQMVNAKAFTLGKDVVFGEGQYAPETSEGKRLISHELTHMIQQGKSFLLPVQRRIGKKDALHYANKITWMGEDNKMLVPSLYPSSSGIVQRAMICSKRLEAPVIGWFANHSYIDDTGRNDCLGAGKAGNYAITNLVSGNFLRGCATKTDHSPDPRNRKPNKKPCEPAPGVTDISSCLRNAFNRYTDPSLYANPSGPNSNTFAGTLARACCKDASSSGLGWVPGWNHAPATSCPPRATFLALGLPATTLGAGGGFRGLMERDRQRVKEMLKGGQQ